MSNQPHPANEITGIHRLPLWGALAVAVFAVVAVIGSVIAGIKPVTAPVSETVIQRDLVFRDGKQGQVLVFDAKSRKRIASFAKGEGAFVRISMRSMTRTRILQKIDITQPYRLVLKENSNLFITDPLSGNRIRVNAFGPIAIENFTQFLQQDYSNTGS